MEVISVKIGRILLWGRTKRVANEKRRRRSREGRGDGRLTGKQGFNTLTGLSTKSSPKLQTLESQQVDVTFSRNGREGIFNFGHSGGFKATLDAVRHRR